MLRQHLGILSAVGIATDAPGATAIMLGICAQALRDFHRHCPRREDGDAVPRIRDSRVLGIHAYDVKPAQLGLRSGVMPSPPASRLNQICPLLGRASIGPAVN